MSDTEITGWQLWLFLLAVAYFLTYKAFRSYRYDIASWIKARFPQQGERAATFTPNNTVVVNVSSVPELELTSQTVPEATASLETVDCFPWLADTDGDSSNSDCFHVMIAAPARVGKTTLAKAILAWRSYAGKVLLITPHATRDNWPIEGIGDGRNFAAINQAMLALLSEMDRRFAAPKGATFTSLTVVIDEWPAIQDECPDATRVLKKLAMEAGKVRIRLVVLAQSELVEDLGLKGSSDIKKSFSRVLLGDFARKIKPELKGRFVAVLSANGYDIAMKIDHLLELAQKPINPTAIWVFPEIETSENSSVSGEKPEEKFSGLETEFSALQSDFTISILQFSELEIAQIAAKIAQGKMSKTEIVKSMPGYAARKHKEFSAYYDKLAAAISGIESEVEI